MRHSSLLAALAALLAIVSLNACGTRGGLKLPPGPAPAPIFGNPPPEKSAGTAATPAPEPASATDLNTATEAQK